MLLVYADETFFHIILKSSSNPRIIIFSKKIKQSIFSNNQEIKYHYFCAIKIIDVAGLHWRTFFRITLKSSSISNFIILSKKIKKSMFSNNWETKFYYFCAIKIIDVAGLCWQTFFCITLKSSSIPRFIILSKKIKQNMFSNSWKIKLLMLLVYIDKHFFALF
jgi:hypothetical protein